MTLRTRFTELVGCMHPISCAGMGMASPNLAKEVALAGGLGMTSGVMIPPVELEKILGSLKGNMTGQIGVNFLIPFLEDESSVEIAAANARVVDFFYGDPDQKLVKKVHEAKALAAWQVGSVREAQAAVDAGCDFVILQGTEAGGHVRGTRGLLTMMADVLDAIDIPLVAAGGIATPRAVAMALSCGASAVRIGTRFVATPESGYHPDYIDAIIASEGEDAVYTENFSIGWEAPHRVLADCIEASAALEDDIIGKIDFGGQEIDVPRNSVFGPMVQTSGKVDAMAQYAGQGVSAIKSCEPAAEILRQLADGAESIIRTERDNLARMLEQ